jgi:hypothetical protein
MTKFSKYTDKDDSKYIDKNGNDIRYGIYIDGIWGSDPPEIIAMKKSGEWDKFNRIQKSWAWDQYLTFDQELMEEVHQSTLEMLEWSDNYVSPI